MTALGKLLRTTVFKLSLAYLVFFAIGCGLLLARVGFSASVLFDEQISNTIDAEINGLSEAYERGGIRRLVDAVDRRASLPGSAIYLVTTFAGQTVVGNVAEIARDAVQTPGGSEISYRRIGDDGPARPAVARVFILANGFRLVVGRDLGDREELRWILLRTLLAALGWLSVVGVIGGAFVAARVLRRVDAMSDSARTIMLGDLSRRLPLAGTGDEIDRLAGNLNAMLDRITDLMTGLREVSDNIAHDLKTPLTRLRNRAEEALRASANDETRRSALERIIGESDGLIRTFDGLLMIARLEAGSLKAGMSAVDVNAALSDVVELYEPSAEEAGLSIVVEGDEGLYVEANRDLLARALSNLVDNALKYGAPTEGASGVAASIQLSARRDGDAIEIAVRDHGPGIPDPADRARALDRFTRLDASRSAPGSGLGLSLVAAIARVHKGTLRLDDNAPGLSAVMRLPASRPPPAPALPAPVEAGVS